jgi:hypothetical protein
MLTLPMTERPLVHEANRARQDFSVFGRKHIESGIPDRDMVRLPS